MYNRYVPTDNGYQRIVVEDREPSNVPPPPPPFSPVPPETPPTAPSPAPAETTGPRQGLGGLFGKHGPLGGLTSLLGLKGGGNGASTGLGQLLSQWNLEGLDAGDIVLVLIILLLYLDGDNTELLITLGLLFLMGL